jgi:hypothetical protein
MFLRANNFTLKVGLASNPHLEGGGSVMRTAPIAVAAACLAGCGVAVAGPQSGTLTLRAFVPVHASAAVLSAPSTLEVTPVDVQRGYIEASAPLAVSVTTNSRSGFILAFNGTQDFYSGLQIDGLGANAHRSRAEAWVVQPTRPGTTYLELRVRFLLAADVAPGSYPWPLTVSVAAP